MIIPVDRDCVRCPKCGNRLTDAQRGRRTGRWFRHCIGPCMTSTVCNEPPSAYVGPRSHAVLPHDAQPELPYEPRQAFTRTGSIAKAYDARMRQTGEVA